ncbi:MAG: hypothetical protein AAF799_35690 [Myxococcota bacterium]
MKTLFSPHWSALALCLSVLAPLSFTACDEGVAGVQDGGTLRMGLSGTDDEGRQYVLTDAVFDVTGQENVQLSTASLPTPTTPIVAGLGNGAYQIELQPGWVLQRLDPAGTQSIPLTSAMLTSANPVDFSIIAFDTTNVTFVFSVDGEEVVIGEGTLEVDIDIEVEGSCDPLLQNCPEGEGCYPIEGGATTCASSSGVGPGNPCLFINECAPGLMCVAPTAVPGCEGTEGGCCTSFCDTTDPDPDGSCGPGLVCSAFGEPGSDIESTGVCTLAPFVEECDVLLQNCPAGEACYATENGILCAPTQGAGTEGAACSFINECAPGLACGDNGTCNPYCEQNSDCNVFAQTCQPVLDAQGNPTSASLCNF